MPQKPGPKPREKNELAVGITVYIKKMRILNIGKGDYDKGKIKARKMAAEAINKEV